MEGIGHTGERRTGPGDPEGGRSAGRALLGRGGSRPSTLDRRDLGAVLFTDIVGSTAIAAEMGNTRWSELVGRHHRVLRRLIGRFGGHEVDTAGDGFFVT